MTVGVLVCSYNDKDLSEKMYPSLLRSIHSDMPPFVWGLVCVDAGSTDGSIDYWEGKCPTISKENDQLLKLLSIKGEDMKHLSHALNAGIKLMMFEDGEGQHKYRYICHIHPDMEFDQKGWLNAMTNYMDENPDVGKLAAEYASLAGGSQSYERPGNGCPWMMRVSAIQKLLNEDGFVFDPKFRGIGGWEDHDINARLINLGYKVWITPKVVVNHEGMGTRKRHNTTMDAIHNAHYYTMKWGINSPSV